MEDLHKNCENCKSCENCILCKAVRCETSFYEDYMAKFGDCEFYAESWEEYEKIMEAEDEPARDL